MINQALSPVCHIHSFPTSLIGIDEFLCNTTSAVCTHVFVCVNNESKKQLGERCDVCSFETVKDVDSTGWSFLIPPFLVIVFFFGVSARAQSVWHDMVSSWLLRLFPLVNCIMTH